MRVLELYCGIGGLAAALAKQDDFQVVAAVDINRQALAVYCNNFQSPAVALSLESVPIQQFEAWEADLWWLSPPCQPYTRRGHRRDLLDPRSQSLLRILQVLAEVRPAYVGLENVPGFVGSRGYRHLLDTLRRSGYQIRQKVLCPTQLGIPNRRERFYLIAGRRPLKSWPKGLASKEKTVVFQQRLADLLDSSPDPALYVASKLQQQYEGALDLVDPDDAEAVCGCFTSAYGRSIVRSGSYLRSESGLRRFSPEEILRLLGFPEWYQLPTHLSFKQAWPLVGNSLSVWAVACVLNCLPEFRYRCDFGECCPPD